MRDAQREAEALASKEAKRGRGDISVVNPEVTQIEGPLPIRNANAEAQAPPMLLTNAENGLVRVLKKNIYNGILSFLDARSVIRLSWTCRTLAKIPVQEWRAEKVLEWFVQDPAVLQAGMRATRSVGLGNCLHEFFMRSPGSGVLELFILVDTSKGFESMTQVFLDEDYKQEDHELDGQPFSRVRFWSMSIIVLTDQLYRNACCLRPMDDVKESLLSSSVMGAMRSMPF